MAGVYDVCPPPFGRSTLAEVLPAIAAHLVGAGTGTDVPGAVDGLGLPAARRYVLCLVDGLGAELLAQAAEDAPHLAGVLPGAVRLVSTIPSTTATAITTLGTGVPPGRHGIMGYTFRSAPHRLLNALTWENGPRDPAAFQPVTPWWTRLAGEGVAVSAVAPADFMGTGLTRAALRGARFVPVENERDFPTRTAQVAAAAGGAERALVYVYERALDHTGHNHGWRSPQWRRVLHRLDGFVADLRARLDADTCLLVTGDHGMVDVPARRKIWVEDDRRLMRHVELVGGEARLRQLYTAAPEAVAAAWRAVLGEQAEVVLGPEAVDAGWFGPVAPNLASRIGDVLALARDDWAMTSRAAPGEARMVGMHGGCSPAESAVPLLIDPGKD